MAHSLSRRPLAPALSFLVRQKIDLLHHVGLGRRVAFGDLVDVLHAFHHLAPERVLAGQAAAAVTEADEELAVGAVGIGSARRADAAALVDLGGELGRQIGIARAAGTDALGIAGLR